jgi:hypothetical protein
VKEGHAAFGENERRSSIGSNCGGAHDHPQQRRNVIRLYIEKEDAVGEKGDEDAVESEPYAPQHVDEYEHGGAEAKRQEINRNAI